MNILSTIFQLCGDRAKEIFEKLNGLDAMENMQENGNEVQY